MASTGRRTNPGLKDLLFSRGYDFEFFQAVHLLTRMQPERKPVGRSAAPRQEIVRFGAHASISFPASQIHSIEEKRGQARMTVAFLGLTGPQTVLPLQYTELLIERILSKDESFAEFLDIFNHRLISLFYRAWEKHHFPVGYERERAGDTGADQLTRHLFALIGMGTAGLQNRLPIPDLALLRYAGLIAQRPHSASALRGLLADYFYLPVEVDQFRGKWLPLEDANLAYLSEPGLHNQLGLGAIAGDAVWDTQAQFRLRVGAIVLKQFVQFLPDQPAYRTLTETTRYFCGEALEFEVQLVLKAAEVPPCRLTDETFDAPRLGWLGWLKTDEFEHDAADAVFLEKGAA